MKRTLARVTLAVAALALAPPAGAGPVRVAAVRADEIREWDRRIDAMTTDGTLAVRKVREDPLLPGREHVRYAQVYLGLPVFGGDLARQTDGPQTVSVFGSLYEGIALDPRPRLTGDQAAGIVAALTGETLGASHQPELGVFARPEGGYALAYQARVFTPSDLVLLFLDARTGEVLFRRSDLQTQSAVGHGKGVLGDDKKVSARQSSGRFVTDDVLRPPALATYDLKGNLSRTIAYLNGQVRFGDSDFGSDSDNDWTDGAAVDAHVYAGYTYDFYFKRFGRRGLDGNDLGVSSVVHPVRREDLRLYSDSIIQVFYVNAFYAGRGMMVYGEGLPEGVPFQGQQWNYFAGGLDVVAHELTHGVTDYTSRLVYEGESGALNESFSDMMGTACEFFFQPPGSGRLQADYLLGEDIVTPGAVRSMSNPGLFGDPDHYSRRFAGAQDNGGVHTNSGIPNHVFYLSIEGGTNRTSGLSVTGVGAANRDQVEKVMYRAFTLMMPARATFAVARAVTLQSARDLYGAGSAAERALAQAWTAVGVS
jgi:thermolysin